ncbi:MAG: SRPBCC family protein [Acidimicrobiales bacterium]
MNRATRGAVFVHVGASPERVYELVSDVTRMGEWSPETYRCRWIGSDGPVPGARFKGYNRRGRARWSNTLEVLSAEPGREFSFRRDVLPCGVCDWRYRIEPDGAGTLLTESYVVVKPDWRITNWFNGLLLGVADRDEDLLAGMQTTLARIKETAEADAHSGGSTRGTTRSRGVSER